MKKISRVKKFVSNKYKFVLRFVLENSTVVTVTALALLVLSGATYSVVALGFNDENSHDKTAKLKSLNKVDLNKLTDSTASRPKGEQTTKDTDHSVNTEDGKAKGSQKSPSQSSPSNDTKSSGTANHSTSSISPSPAKPATCPYRAFDVYLGPLARNNDSDTISYTATYTITPTCANFGNPNVTISITTGMHYSPCINMADRNNGIISITRR
jgi:hypothetical protein